MTIETIRSGGASLDIHLDAPSWDGRRTAALGSLSFPSVETGAGVVAQALKFLEGRGYQGVLGPMNGDTWHRYRVVIESDGSRAFPLEPTSGPHDLAVLTEAGFFAVSEYVSSRTPVADLPPSCVPPDGIAVRAWDGSNAGGLTDHLFRFSEAAFAKAAFYKPIAREAFLALYAPVIAMLDPRLVFFAHSRDDTIVGFLFGYPDRDPNGGIGGAVIKTYASMVHGVGRSLVDAFNDEARNQRLEHVVHALMNVGNVSLRRSESNNGLVFRRYALMAKALDL